MNIIFVIDAIVPLTNGSVMTAVRCADGLKKLGHDVKIIAIGSKDYPLEERYIPLITWISAKNQIKFAKFNKDLIKAAFSNADIVHFIFPFKLEKKCKKLADEMNIPSTAAFHVQPENMTYNAHINKLKFFNSIIYYYFRKTFYDKFNRVHCPTEFISNELKKHKYKAKTHVISNGYDPDFKLPEEKSINSKFEIVMVGRLSPEKNQKVIIDAISKSKYKDLIHLTLLGNGTCKNKLIKKAKKLNVDVSFDFLPKEKLIKKLQQCDLYIHSAIVDIEAISCIEAIACGLVPVISVSKLSATKQFALDDRSLFKNNDALDLAKKIDYWFENTDERNKMSLEYANYAKSFSLDKSLEKLINMFNEEINS